MLVSAEVEMDKYVSDELRHQIYTLEHGPCKDIAMFFVDDEEKDRLAVNHLIHCMKVVADHYADWDQPKYFDYSSAD